MKNMLLKALAYFLLVLGFIVMFLPIPGGIIIVAGALTMLICTDSYARYCLKWMRTKLNWFNKAIFWLENKIGVRIKIMGDALKLTHPSEDEADKALSHSAYIKKVRAEKGQ